ncbi:MAG: hypothetical protein F4Y94_08635 [Chloroflexi bacterium]|nr:hypothetical protein [Chloroflexota bacterium]
MTTILPWLALAASATFGGIVGMTLAKLLAHIRRAEERHQELLSAIAAGTGGHPVARRAR